MKKIMQLFLPKEKIIYEHFKELSHICVEIQKGLENLLKEYNSIERSERKSRILQFKVLKLKAEGIHFDIVKKIGSSTDKDKRILEKIADELIEGCRCGFLASSSLMEMGIERIDVYMIKLCDIVVELCNELAKCMDELRKARSVKEHCKNIHALENKADDAFSEAMSELFHFFKNSLDVIKYKSFYEMLEKTADHANNCALLIERID